MIPISFSGTGIRHLCAFERGQIDSPGDPKFYLST